MKLVSALLFSALVASGALATISQPLLSDSGAASSTPTDCVVQPKTVAAADAQALLVRERFQNLLTQDPEVRKNSLHQFIEKMRVFNKKFIDDLAPELATRGRREELFKHGKKSNPCCHCYHTMHDGAEEFACGLWQNHLRRPWYTGCVSCKHGLWEKGYPCGTEGVSQGVVEEGYDLASQPVHAVPSQQSMPQQSMMSTIAPDLWVSQDALK